jgi:hypothetical protein
MASAQEVAAVFSQYRLTFHTEAELQTVMAEILTDAKIPHEREVRVDARNRLDFLCEGGLAIETKLATNKGPASLRRQLQRYADLERVTAILVVSNGFISGIPDILSWKPITFHFLTGSSF